MSVPVLAVFLCDSGVLGVVSRSNTARTALFVQNRRISAKQAWQTSSFHSEDTGRGDCSPALCPRAWLEVPFLPGEGLAREPGPEACVSMTWGLTPDFCIV